jgi:hypothetical protein
VGKGDLVEAIFGELLVRALLPLVRALLTLVRALLTDLVEAIFGELIHVGNLLL